jgi:hypothetical protein
LAIAEALYVGFDADDADITARFDQRDDPTYRDDAVEIFINPNPKQEVVYASRFRVSARSRTRWSWSEIAARVPTGSGHSSSWFFSRR